MSFETKNVNNPVEKVSYGETVIPVNRLKYLSWKCKETLKRTPGNVLEVGVYRGGTLIALAETLKEICPEYKVHGIDTFTGHPYSDGHPVHPKGKYSDLSKEELENYIEKKGLSENIILHSGKVEKILKSLKLENISFAHIDCDLYFPIKYCAQNIPLIMREHGVIYFDDYGHEHCPGATKAIEEVLDINQIHPVYMPEDNTCWSGYVQL